jgi:hypothetical protein
LTKRRDALGQLAEMFRAYKAFGDGDGTTEHDNGTLVGQQDSFERETDRTG